MQCCPRQFYVSDSAQLQMTEISDTKTTKMSMDEETSLGEYFLAGYDLNIDKLNLIIDSGQVEINSVYNLGKAIARDDGMKEEHMQRSFGASKNGKVTCKIFEKIDFAQQTELKLIVQIIKVRLTTSILICI